MAWSKVYDDHHVRCQPGSLLTAMTRARVVSWRRCVRSVASGCACAKAITESLRSMFEFPTNLIPGRSKHAKREKAIATYASLVGGMILGLPNHPRVVISAFDPLCLRE